MAGFSHIKDNQAVSSKIRGLPESLRPPDITAKIHIRGHSSAGRAPAWHAGGREFESPWLHLGKFLLFLKLIVLKLEAF